MPQPQTPTSPGGEADAPPAARRPLTAAEQEAVIKMDSLIAVLSGWVKVGEDTERAYQALPPPSQSAIANSGLLAAEDMHMVMLSMNPEARRQNTELAKGVVDALVEVRNFVCDERETTVPRYGPDDIDTVAHFLSVLSSLGARSRRQLRFFFESARNGDQSALLMVTKGRKSEVRVMTRVPPELETFLDGG